MRTLLAFFVPSLYRQPQIGDRYRHIDSDGNPFDHYLTYTVKELKDGWALLSYGRFGSTQSTEIRNLLAFYREVKS